MTSEKEFISLSDKDQDTAKKIKKLIAELITLKEAKK